ncbi:MAG: TatD family hydrolase, partial [Aestuariivirga sp.]
MALIVDSHCHLDYDGLADQLDAILDRSAKAGVGLMLSISSRVKNFPKLLALAEAHDEVYCTVGTHPHNA